MKKIVIFVLIAAVGVAAGIGLLLYPDFQEKQPSVLQEEDDDENTEEEAASSDPLHLSFSHDKTFYSESIDVEITCKDKDAVIYYTLNGATPDSSSTKYAGPIPVRSGNTVSATTIKAIAIKDGESSEMRTKSYVTGKDVFERFDGSTYIFVLSTDPYNLYDYYYGIAVEGYIRDQWLQNEYTGGEIPYNAPANWYMSGRESERDMYVEVYDCDGHKLIEQAAGARVVGGYSRANEQKSWRLIARNEYSEGNGKFKYAFFFGATDAYGQLLTRFDRITLRNGANDREFAGIRDEVALQLAKNAGFPDIQETVPAAVFLNGEYYGFSWLHEAYCNDYLENTYGGNKENFRIVDGKENDVKGDDEQSVNDYNYMYDLAAGGLTEDARFEEFCSLVDIDNFMLYYAIQIYINNEDWPGNNFKAWRYYPSDGEEPASPYLDGKWRFMLFDAEFGMGLYGNGYSEPTLSYVLDGRHMQGASGLLKAVLERKDMKAKFANTICDLMYGEFSYDKALAVINYKIEQSEKECMYALNNGYTSGWANEWTFADSRQQIRDFFFNRPNVMLKDLKRVLELDDEMFQVTLSVGEGGTAYLNSIAVKNGKTAGTSYFSAYSVPVSAYSYKGYTFSHWEINGERIDGAVSELTSDMAQNGNISVKAVFEKVEVSGEPLYISCLYTSGDSDSITLYNPNSVDISTAGYFLSDKFDELDRWEIPTVTIPAESELIIVCKNNKDSTALHKLVTNFNLKVGETLYLTDPSGNIVSKTAVVAMDKRQCLVRQADGTYKIETLY